MRQRRITPPVYNESRINEQPIPKLVATEKSTNSSNSNNQASQGIDDLIISSPNHDVNDKGNDSLVIQSPNDNMETSEYTDEECVIDEISNVEEAIDPLQIKDEYPIAIINSTVDDVIDDLVGGYEVIDDDIEICYEDISCFIPKKHAFEIKRNDIFSGTLP